MSDLATVKLSPGMKRMLEAMKDPDVKKSGLWDVVVAQFTANVQDQFDAEGINPKWPALSPKYAARKHSTYTLSGKRAKKSRDMSAKSHKILQLTQHLKKAAGGDEAHGFRAIMNKLTMMLRVEGIPYAARHNYGYPGKAGRGHARTPQREFFKIATQEAMDEMNKAVQARMYQYLQGLKG